MSPLDELELKFAATHSRLERVEAELTQTASHARALIESLEVARADVAAENDEPIPSALVDYALYRAARRVVEVTEMLEPGVPVVLREATAELRLQLDELDRDRPGLADGPDLADLDAP